MVQDVLLELVLRFGKDLQISTDDGTVRPVPNDTTHCRGVLGHNNLTSCNAIAVGLLTKIPPSWKKSINE